MRRTIGFTVLISLTLAFDACRPTTRAELNVAEQMSEIGDVVNDLRQQSAEQQQQLDSLRLIVARQDTVIRQLANLAGVSVPK
jgi:hypothetical protein